MKPLESRTIEVLAHDSDARETLLREAIADRLGESPPPRLDDQIVATYFLSLRTISLEKASKEIAYHATSGIKEPPPGSLLEECTATMVGVDRFDSTGRMGLLHVAFPLKMLLKPDGSLTSVDILHTSASAVIFDMYENKDARLVSLRIPDRVLAGFPGPALGPEGLRARAKFPKDRHAFGTILKPTAGITAEDVGRIVAEVAGCPLLMFIKEDENLYPRLGYSPVAERVKQAIAAINAAKNERGGLGLIFAPHVTGTPHEIAETVFAALDAGANGVMFSESFAGGAVRLVREATKHLEAPPAIYGHNAGIGVKTKGGIFREVIDFLARLDGIDFRQTAPVRPEGPYIRPFGLEWEASETALSQPIPGIKPTMIARAGGLDQGNLLLNLEDADRRGMTSNILFLAGSAINSIKNPQGRTDPRYGTESLQQALDLHLSGELRGAPASEHLQAVRDAAERKGLRALRDALRQRYPES